MTLAKISNQLPSIFDRFFENEILDWSRRNYSSAGTTLPSVNIKENTEGYEVEVAAPGLDKKDFNIELNNNVLLISAEKEQENEVKEDDQFTRKEFSYQSFSRSFTLPDTVNAKKIHAKYKDGILRIVIPKKEEAKPKPPKQISIS